MSAMALKIIASISMLLDHIGYVFDISIFRIIGRLAFPLYLYLIYNGYKHTSSKWFYAVRLAVFAMVAQIPFSLFTTGKLLTANGNVLVTFFICLICIWITDAMLKNKVSKWISFLPTLIAFAVYFFGYMHSDYGPKAVLMSFVFVVIYGKGKGFWAKVWTTLGITCAVFYSYILKWILMPFYIFMEKNPTVPSLSSWETVQVFSLLALPLIFLYNNKRGKWPFGKVNAKVVQYGFYLFYPLHMLVLWGIMVVMNYLM